MSDYSASSRFGGTAEAPHEPRGTAHPGGTHSGPAGTHSGDPNPGGAPASDGQPDSAGPAAVDRVLDDLRELLDQVKLYLAARADQVKLSVRRIVLGIMLGLFGAMVGGAVLITSGVILVTGIARGLGALFGHRLWLGQIVTGVMILAVTALVIYWFVHRMTGTSRWNTIKRYAELHKQHNSRRPRQPVGK